VCVSMYNPNNHDDITPIGWVVRDDSFRGRSGEGTVSGADERRPITID